MKKRMFRKLHSPALSERLAKYAQPDQKTLERSEQKWKRSIQDELPYEDEVHGVAEYKRNRFAPVISLAACAVLVAGIGGIYAMQANKPDINPGSTTEQIACKVNFPPFGNIAAMELWFTDDAHPTHPDTSYTISPGQQAALSDALCAYRWEEPLDLSDFPLNEEDYIGMHFLSSVDWDDTVLMDTVKFYLNSNVVVWMYWTAFPDCKPQPMIKYYEIDEDLSGCIRNIVQEGLLTHYPNYITDHEDERFHYMYHGFSSAYTFSMFGFTEEPDILFMTEDSAPECYTIPPYQQDQLAEYINNREAWEIMPEDIEYDNPETSEHFCMYISYLGVESVVTFWNDGYITEQSSDSHTYCWWKTKPEMYASMKMLIEKRQDSFTLPYQSFEEAEQNPVKVLEALFGEKGAPFGDISEDSIRGMCPAYAPYVSEIPEEHQKSVAEAINNAVWREIDPDTPPEDGESYQLFIWNSGEPYKLVFYAYKMVLWDNGTEQRKFRTSADISGLVYDAMNYEDVLDHLTRVEPSDNMIPDVWTAVNDAAEEADLSAYEAVVDQFNREHRTTYAIASREVWESGGGNYADFVKRTLEKTPEQIYAELQKTYEENPPEHPQMPWLEGDLTISYRESAAGPQTVLSLTEEQLSELTALVNDTYWESFGQKAWASGKVPELPISDGGDGWDHAYIIMYDNRQLTLYPEEHIAVWHVDTISGENFKQYLNHYFNLWDELEALLESIEK